MFIYICITTDNHSLSVNNFVPRQRQLKSSEDIQSHNFSVCKRPRPTNEFPSGYKSECVNDVDRTCLYHSSISLLREIGSEWGNFVDFTFNSNESRFLGQSQHRCERVGSLTTLTTKNTTTAYVDRSAWRDEPSTNSYSPDSSLVTHKCLMLRRVCETAVHKRRDRARGN